MKKILLIVLTIVLLTGCNTLNNSNDIQETVPNDSKQELTNESGNESSVDKQEISVSIESVANSIKVETFLRQEIKELEPLENYIYQKSNKEAFMLVECDLTLHKVDFEGTEDEYYLVYVGEQYNERKVNWCCFYVSKNLDKILSYDIVEGEAYSLSEWRETEIYSEKFGFLNE